VCIFALRIPNFECGTWLTPDAPTGCSDERLWHLYLVTWDNFLSLGNSRYLLGTPASGHFGPSKVKPHPLSNLLPYGSTAISVQVRSIRNLSPTFSFRFSGHYGPSKVGPHPLSNLFLFVHRPFRPKQGRTAPSLTNPCPWFYNSISRHQPLCRLVAFYSLLTCILHHLYPAPATAFWLPQSFNYYISQLLSRQRPFDLSVGLAIPTPKGGRLHEQRPNITLEWLHVED
jgi:hypothetical protein